MPQGQRFGCEKKPIDLCTCESEGYEHGVGAGANSTLADSVRTIDYSVSDNRVEFARAKVWLQKNPMDLCACEREEREDGVGAGVNSTLLSDTL